jgi:hypothetical protein
MPHVGFVIDDQETLGGGVGGIHSDNVLRIPYLGDFMLSNYFRVSALGKILNVEHRTPNIERPILLALRFIYFNNRITESANGGAVWSDQLALVSPF